MAETGIDILKAKALLEAGQLVAIPTETVYGLAGNALNPSALSKIFTTKNRPHFDPLIVHIHSLDQLPRYAQGIPEKAMALAKHFWPGPLTLVLPRQQIIPDLATAGLDTVGIRCPRHPLTHALLKQLDFPLAAPSANPFGYVSPTTPAHVQDQLGELIPYILDGGPCEVGLESSIVGFEGHEVVLYRRGGLSQEQMEAVAGKIEVRTHNSSNPIAPGQLASHYAPGKKVILGKTIKELNELNAADVALLRFKTLDNQFPAERQIVLSPTGNLEEAAQHLFSSLRQLDKWDVKVILAEEVPNTGIGKAINDRLQRAAAQ